MAFHLRAWIRSEPDPIMDRDFETYRMAERCLKYLQNRHGSELSWAVRDGDES